MTHRFLQAASTTRHVLFFLSATPTPTKRLSTTMENKKAIICWVHSEDSSFQVDICPEKTIYQLKKAIVEEKRNRFREIDPDELKVYVAMIPDTDLVGLLRSG
jgi:hypothetical protein